MPVCIWKRISAVALYLFFKTSDFGTMSFEAPQLEYCVFCNIIRGTEPSYKIFESDHVVGFLGEIRNESLLKLGD